MYQIDFNHPVSVFFVGIGGISMSGLAQILASEGFTVSGSDRSESAATRELQASGIRVMIGQRAENITDDIDLAVFTAAIHPDNPEYIAVHEKGIPSLSRAELLGQLMKNYRLPVAVSGTHGKTTTTSMLSEILLAANVDPTLSIGGNLPDIGGNVRIGSSGYFVAEACEYTNSFLHMFPGIGVILNIEEDHLDFYKDLADIRHSFRLFAEILPEDGTLVVNGEIPDLPGFTQGLKCHVLPYGTADCLYTAENIRYDQFGFGSFDLLRDGVLLGRISLNVPGKHNISNSLAAITAADAMGIGFEAMSAGLSAYHGTDRRFQKKGEVNGAVIIDDYAHHPTEIQAILDAARNYPHKKIWCVFQPHTYTRTSKLFDRFADVLAQADEVLLAPIYAARETDTLGVSSDKLAEAVRARGTEATSYPCFEQIEDYLREHAQEGDLILTVGAGDVTQVGSDLAEKAQG